VRKENAVLELRARHFLFSTAVTTTATNYAAFSSDVQCGHRVAASGMSIAQYGQGLVVAAAAGFL